jgi:predicted enzyme related to lactoylglutathione lyase
MKMTPAPGDGKICYLQIPATDLARSMDFYVRVFGWTTRTRGDGATAFDDGAGAVSGEWVTGRAPMAEPGLMVYVMVEDAAAAVERVVENGGEIVQPLGFEPPEITAWFRDPGGNVLGIYQEPGA